MQLPEHILGHVSVAPNPDGPGLILVCDLCGVITHVDAGDTLESLAWTGEGHFNEAGHIV